MPESIRDTPSPGGDTTDAAGAGGTAILLQDERILVATVGSYVVLINGGDLGDSGVNAVREAFESKSEEPKVGYLVVLEPEVTLMLPSEVRSHLAAILSQFAERIGGVAVLYEGSGFKATGIRSIATAIQLASRTTFPHKAFSNLLEAVTFLSSSMPGGTLPDAPGLQTQVEPLRERARCA